ncbi:unnamed protein product [Rhizophagus irregularis]|uniref:Uncharacterized protein n=1 Tax=Rhizophagus irregularis TaxID=588596 RepID=A0A2I1HAF2_9GLOM|nr:hypothetical protein RhiirA4_548945 [Rhizophagus irregularis]CAB4430389.1 unnamed protein product [Rhizophagus irregularis]CAB4446397.1 unnamed protein product [Rhizophagus irregularis]
MNSNYSNNQFFGPDNNLSFQLNPEQTAAGSHMNNPYMDVQNSSIHLSNQYYDNSGQISVNSSIVQDNFAINQLVHPLKFVYRPPNDIYIYRIKCKEISIQLLNEFSNNVSNININQNEYIFFYQQQNDNRIYQVVCEIVSPSFIINFLNKIIYGIEIEQNIGEELTFKFDQKEYLKFYLTQYLNGFSLN